MGSACRDRITDYHIDSTTEYAYNEVTIDYNAAFVGALAGCINITDRDMNLFEFPAVKTKN